MHGASAASAFLIAASAALDPVNAAMQAAVPVDGADRRESHWISSRESGRSPHDHSIAREERDRSSPLGFIVSIHRVRSVRSPESGPASVASGGSPRVNLEARREGGLDRQTNFLVPHPLRASA
jgi:hypothetical protein